MAEITKAQLAERERNSWIDMIKRMEFLSELLYAKTDKILVRDASIKLGDTLTKYKIVLKQRILVEFGPSN